MHVHGNAGVLPVDLAGVQDGAEAEVAHVGGKLIEVAVEEEEDVGVGEVRVWRFRSR